MNEVFGTLIGGTVEEEAAVMLSEPIVATYRAFFFVMPMMVTKEVLRFLSHRLEKQAALASALAGCRTFSDVVETQAAFLGTALGDYGKEARTIVHRARQELP